jgi:hypothetical protein
MPLSQSDELIACEQNNELPKCNTEPYCALAIYHQQVRAAEARGSTTILIPRTRTHAFRIILLEPLFRGIHICEQFDVVFVSDLLARVDVNKNCHWSLFSLRRLRQSRSYLVRCANMASQAVSASANVLKGNPPTLIAGLLIWMGRQEATKPGLP